MILYIIDFNLIKKNSVNNNNFRIFRILLFLKIVQKKNPIPFLKLPDCYNNNSLIRLFIIYLYIFNFIIFDSYSAIRLMNASTVKIYNIVK